MGESPHKGSQAVAHNFGIDISQQRSQHTSEFDLASIPYLCVMDHQNYQDVLGSYTHLTSHTPPVLMMRFFEDKGIYTNEDWAKTSMPHHATQLTDYPAVPDPYYGRGSSAFTEVYHILSASCQGLLNYIVWQQNKSV